jgi:hypothetical protein
MQPFAATRSGRDLAPDMPLYGYIVVLTPHGVSANLDTTRLHQ